MGEIPFEGRILRSVIYIQNSCGKFGTGVLISHKTPEGDRISLFIITNKHVLQDEKRAFCDYIIVRFYNKPEVETQSKIVNVKIELKYNGELSNRVFLHPEKQVDLVGILINDLTQSIQRIDYVTLDENLLLTRDKIIDEVIEIGENVLVLGYPAGVYSQENYLPVAKSGIIASSPYENLTLQFGKEVIKGKIILVDSALFGGSSGGPVFIKPRWKVEKDRRSGKQTVQLGTGIPTYLLGIQSSAIESNEKIYTRIIKNSETSSQVSDTTVVEKDEKGEYFYLSKPIMLNLVFSAEYIFDIFKEFDKRFPISQREIGKHDDK